MKIHYHDSNLAGILKPYYTVLVEPGEFTTPSGKPVPHCWLGTIDTNGDINLWTPAGYKPRDYAIAARKILEQAREKVLEAQASGNPIIDPL